MLALGSLNPFEISVNNMLSAIISRAYMQQMYSRGLHKNPDNAEQFQAYKPMSQASQKIHDALWIPSPPLSNYTSPIPIGADCVFHFT